MARLPFSRVKDSDTLGDLLSDLAREEQMNAELEDPSEELQPWYFLFGSGDGSVSR
jgi:hypothetical protein